MLTNMIKHTKPNAFHLPRPPYVETDAPVIEVRLGEIGYYPIYGQKPDVLPEGVAEAALAASIFGWHTEAALPALAWLESKVSL